MTEDEITRYIVYGVILLTFFIVLKMPKKPNDKNFKDKEE